MKLCIDPGHQLLPDLSLEPISPGSTLQKPKCASGTFGILTKKPEYEIVLEVALLVEALLIPCNCQVVLTRRSNNVQLSNITRAGIANESGADFWIRLHCNGVNHQWKSFFFWKRGVLTLVPEKNFHTEKFYEASCKIAEIFHSCLVSTTRFPNLGIERRSNLTGFNWSEIPVVLLELGYLTNFFEESCLVDKDYIEKMSLAIAKSVLEAYETVKF